MVLQVKLHLANVSQAQELVDIGRVNQQAGNFLPEAHVIFLFKCEFIDVDHQLFVLLEHQTFLNLVESERL